MKIATYIGAWLIIASAIAKDPSITTILLFTGLGTLSSVAIHVVSDELTKVFK
jgi:hypothetical protein